MGLWAAHPASAELALDPSCTWNEGQAESCSHLVGCIAGETAFVGRDMGWDTGTLDGTLADGTSCTGTWDSFQGAAQFECENGLSGQVVYWFQDEVTGTSLGSGATAEGRPIETWSGPYLADYASAEFGRPVLQCGATTIPLN